MPQSLAHLGLHVTFSTKNRVPMLKGPSIVEELPRHMGAALNNLKSPCVAIGVQPDHVHFLCLLSRNLSVAELVKEWKRISSIWISEGGGVKEEFHWQSGYGAFSVSASNIARAQNYIKGQERHHKKFDFQDEFRSLLRRHGIEYDERYVWD